MQELDEITELRQIILALKNTASPTRAQEERLAGSEKRLMELLTLDAPKAAREVTILQQQKPTNRPKKKKKDTRGRRLKRLVIEFATQQIAEAVKAKIKSSGLRPADFVYRAILNIPIPRVVIKSVIFRAVAIQLRKIGTNFNQAMAIANRERKTPEAQLLKTYYEAVLAEARRINPK